MSFGTSDLNSTATTAQPVAIFSVDTAKRTAIGWTRRGSQITIDLSFHAGAIQVTPAVGEQWFVTRNGGTRYRLDSKIPYNAPELLTDAKEGQVQVGSSGPLELNGSQINTNAPICLPAYASTERPDPATLRAGAVIWGLTEGKPIFCTGTSWVDAAGTEV